MSFYFHTIQLDTNYHEPLTYHRLEILYNQNNIDSQMYSSLHVVLVYTNENNVNNEKGDEPTLHLLRFRLLFVSAIILMILRYPK